MDFKFIGYFTYAETFVFRNKKMRCKMKRIVSLVCAVSVVLSSLLPLQAFAAADSYDLDASSIVIDGKEYKKVGLRKKKMDFNDGLVGTAVNLGGGEVDSAEYVFDFAEISGKADAENHGNVLSRQWTKERTEKTVLRPYNDSSEAKGSGDLFVLSFDIYFEKMYNGSGFSFKAFYKDADGNETFGWNSNFLNLKFADNSIVLGDRYSKSLSIGSWHNIMLAFDFDTAKASVIVDGSALMTSYSFGDKSVTGIGAVEYNPFNASANYERVYMDNLVAYRYVQAKSPTVIGNMEYAPLNDVNMENSEIRIEAEGMTASNNMELIADETASGGYAMRVKTDRAYSVGTDSSPLSFGDELPNPDLTVNINIPKTGAYKIWARVRNASAEAVNTPVWLRFDEWSRMVGQVLYPFPSKSPTNTEKSYIEYPHNYRMKFLNTAYSTSSPVGIKTTYDWVLLSGSSERVKLADGTTMQHGNETTLVLKNGHRELSLIFGTADTVVDEIYIAAATGADSSDPTYNLKPSGKDPSIYSGGAEPYELLPTDHPEFPEMELAGVHPRLFVTKDDIPTIKERLQKPFYSTTYANFKTLSKQNISGLLPENNSCYSKHTDVGETLQARAFMYLLGEVDETHARKTVQELLNLLSTVTFSIQGDSTYNTRNTGTVMVTAALVYDWCYDVMDYSQREFVIRKLKEFVADTEAGWPPMRRNMLSSHPQEGLVYLYDAIVGIAVYDEDPQWYDTTMSVIYEMMRDIRIFGSKSGYDHSIGSYFEARNEASLYLDKMLHVTGGLEEGETIFGDNYPNEFWHLIYRGLPNGTWFKDGDDYKWSNYNGYDKLTGVGILPSYIGAQYNNPYLMAEGVLTYQWNDSKLSVMDVLMFDSDAESKYMCELPLTHMSTYPMTTMMARTGWNQGINSPDAAVFMDMHDTGMDGHEHGDVGSFQLWYKGMLALDSGLYEYSDHYYHYQSRSIAHNVLLVDNGNDDFYQTNTKSATNATNDGGQKNIDIVSRNSYNTYMSHLNQIDENGNITKYGELSLAYEKAHYIGPNAQTPAFSYLSSDISGAYNYQTARTGESAPEKKVADSGYERSMVFINLYDDEFPAAFVVYDNVTSLDASYKKTWLLHSELEPTVSGSETTIVRTENGQNGKLVNKTMYPKADNVNFEIIGGEGKEYWVGGKNWEYNVDNSSICDDAGAYRVEISPKVSSTDDIFLNAMYVTDADNDKALDMEMLETDDYVGVSVKDRIVTFGKTRSNITSSVNLTVPDKGYDKVYCLITDMEAGKWNVTGNGGTFCVESKGDTGAVDDNTGEYCLYFEASPGSYTISPATETAVASSFTMTAVPVAQYGDFRIRNNGNLMYLPKPNKLIDGDGDDVLDSYSAIDGVFTQLGAKNLVANGDTLTFDFTESNGTTNTYEFTAGSTVYKKNGNVVTASNRQIKHPPLMVDGTMYADLTDFGCILSMTTAPTYNSVAKLVTVKTLYEGGKLK